MAGDLIPPPSPAGRPEAEGLRRAGDDAPLWAGGDAVEASRPEASSTEPAAESLASAPSPLARYRSRFGFLTGALMGTGVAAIVVTILIAAGGGTGGGEIDNWSRFQPTAEDTFGRAAQIGGHVGPRYRLDDGSQIVAVQAGPIAFRSEVPAEVVIRTQASGGDIVPVEGKGVLYTFNGLGENGSISVGRKSPERLALLKQAAVEAALYSFHYTDADHVVVVLPPPPPDPTAAKGPTGTTGAAGATQTAPADVLFFRPSDLAGPLAQPLEATVPEAVPRPKDLDMNAVKAITMQTTPQSFVANFQQPADGRVYFVLERPEPPNLKPLGAAKTP
jgi:hypothetical protein